MAPKAEKAPAKAPAKKTLAPKDKKKKIAKAETYKIYIYKCVPWLACLLRVIVGEWRGIVVEAGCVG